MWLWAILKQYLLLREAICSWSLSWPLSWSLSWVLEILLEEMPCFWYKALPCDGDLYFFIERHQTWLNEGLDR